jgi:hypothetical protein
VPILELQPVRMSAPSAHNDAAASHRILTPRNSYLRPNSSDSLARATAVTGARGVLDL